MSENAKQQPVQMTNEMLEKLLTTLTAPKEPTELEELQAAKLKAEQEAAQRKFEQDQADRRATAAEVVALAAKRMNDQKLCTHIRRDGTTSVVFINDGGYLICQKCQAVIRKGEAPKNYSGTDIYNTDLFVKLFQMTSESGIFG